MSGVYTRIEKILEYLGYPFDSGSDIWYALASQRSQILELDHRYDMRFGMHVAKKSLLFSGSTSLLDHTPIHMTAHPLTEILAEKVYAALQEIALRKIEAEFQEEEQKKRDKKKLIYLNNKLFTNSQNFIREED